MPDEKYRRGFNTCFNEVLKCISASDTCKPEMRAKVLSHLVDRFTNQNTAMNCNNQSSHVMENLNSQTASANQSQFLFNEIPNLIPSGAKQSVHDTKYRNHVNSEEDRHTALSVRIPNIVDGQKMNTPVLDQNNNVQHVQIDNVLDNLDKSKGQTENTVHNFGGNLPMVQGSGLVKIASPSATIPNSSKMQFIASGTIPMQSYSGQTSSNQANYAGLSILQPNTTVPSNIFKSNDKSLQSSPVQLIGFPNPSDSISTSQAKPITTPPSMVQCLNYSALPIASPVDGNLTILVPANVIALPTLSPSGSGILLACDGTGSASPISSVQSPELQSIKNISSDIHNFANVNNVQVPKKCVSQELNKVTESVEPESAGSPITDANKLVIQDRLAKPVQNVNRTRYSPYSINASRQTKPLDGNVVADTAISNTNDCRRNNCNASSTFSTSVINTNYNLNHQMNIVPNALEFQTDKISSLCGLTDTQNKETHIKSYFPNQSTISYSSNVWRPWNR